MHRYPVWVRCTVKDQRGKPAGQQVLCHVNSQMHKDTTTIAILEALLKWEDKLIGYRIHVVTDHQALEFFKMLDWLLS